MRIAANIRNLFSGAAVAATMALGVAFAQPGQAAVIGPGVLDFDQVEIGCHKKPSKCVASAIIISNAGEESVTQTYESLFGVEVVEWDRYEADPDTSLQGLIDVELAVSSDTTVGENRWFLIDPLFDPSSIVGFSFKAGVYSVFFSFIAPGLAAGDEIRFNNFDYYAELLLPASEFASLGSKLNAGLSNLVVYGVTTVVPVPAALPLAAAGFGLIGLMGWRRNRRSA